MSRRAWEEAVRWAYNWPGFDLVGYEPVAIPMYSLPLEAVIQKRKPLSTIEEFTLRAIAAGLDSIEDVGGFLGLEPRLAEEAILNQLQASNLSLQPDRDEVRRLRLGPRSVDTLAELATYTTERQEVTVVWDRVTRSIVGTSDRELLSGFHLRVRSLHPSPPGTPPELPEVSVDEIAAAFAKSEGSRLARPNAEAEYELLGISGMGKPGRRYKLAVVLIYRSRRVRACTAVERSWSRSSSRPANATRVAARGSRFLRCCPSNVAGLSMLGCRMLDGCEGGVEANAKLGSLSQVRPRTGCCRDRREPVEWAGGRYAWSASVEGLTQGLQDERHAHRHRHRQGHRQDSVPA